MRLGFRTILLGFVILMALFLVLSILLPSIELESTTRGNLMTAQVTRVVDGDTLKVRLPGQDDEQTIRIIGVDTPETKDPNREVMCYGAEATAKTQDLTARARGQVELEKDISETDGYGRLLRYVWLLNSDGRTMLNEELVKDGYARAVVFPLDRFSAQEAREKQQHLRLWRACASFGAPT